MVAGRSIFGRRDITHHSTFRVFGNHTPMGALPCRSRRLYRDCRDIGSHRVDHHPLSLGRRNWPRFVYCLRVSGQYQPCHKRHPHGRASFQLELSRPSVDVAAGDLLVGTLCWRRYRLAIFEKACIITIAGANVHSWSLQYGKTRRRNRSHHRRSKRRNHQSWRTLRPWNIAVSGSRINDRHVGDGRFTELRRDAIQLGH